MKMTASGKSRSYEIIVTDSKVESILVKSIGSCEQSFYQRGPVKMGLEINNQIFLEAARVVCGGDICRGNIDEWNMFYLSIKEDVEYASLIKDELKKFMKPFSETELYQDVFGA